jgi:hypothetical protein
MRWAHKEADKTQNEACGLATFEASFDFQFERELRTLLISTRRQLCRIFFGDRVRDPGTNTDITRRQ